jgi:hypothetical protein
MKIEQAKSSIRKPFVKCDPLTRLVKDHLHLNLWLVVVIFVLVVNLPLIVYAAVNGTLYSQGSRPGLLREWAWWIYQFSSVPATLLFFLWMPDGILNVLEGLQKNKTILVSGKRDEARHFDAFLTRFDRIYSHWLWTITCVVLLAIFMVVAVVPEQSAFHSWFVLNSITFWYCEAFWYFIFLLGALIVVRVLLSIYWFNRLFKEFRVDIRVLHPDGAGGLSPLGSFSIKVGYLIGIFGMSAVATIWSHTDYLLRGQTPGFNTEPALILLLALYILFAPIVFFAPIGSAHMAMQKAKEDFIINIADQFEVDFAKMQSAIGKDTKDLASSIAKIEQLQNIHKIASSFPVWPFNIGNVIRFFSSTLSPLVLAMIPAIIQLFLH